MPLRAHKIKEVSALSTFELTYDSPLWAALEEIRALKEVGEASGIIVLTETDVAEMDEFLSANFSEEEAEPVHRVLDQIREELDPEWRNVTYWCY